MSGVDIHTSTWRDSGKPIAANTTEIVRKNVAAVPITLRAPGRSLRPIAWPTRMVVAMPKPNTPPSTDATVQIKP